MFVIQKHRFEYLGLRRCTVKQSYVSERKEKEYQVDQILCTFYRDTFNICKKYNEWCYLCCNGHHVLHDFEERNGLKTLHASL